MNQSPTQEFENNNSLPFYKLSFSIVFKFMIPFTCMNRHANLSLPLLDPSPGIRVVPKLGMVGAFWLLPRAESHG